MGREHAGERPLGDEELDTAPWDAAVVGVLGRAARPASLVDGGIDQTGDPRPQAVGADDVAGTDLDPLAGAIMSGHPDHPAVPVSLQPGHGDAAVHLGAGLFGGGGEERVQHVPARRDQEVDPGLVLDRPGGRRTSGVEGDLPDGRSPTVEDFVEQPPAAELDDAAAGDRMRGHGVAREGRLVHDHHVTPETGEQHGGGRPGDSSAHDDDIVTAAVHGLHGHLPPCQDYGWSWSFDRSTDLDEILPRGARLSRPIERSNEPGVERRPIVAHAATAVDTRTLILDAARSRLLADGYAGLSTRKVAEEAGVPVSQLNYHFGSKQGLILSLFAEENRRRLARQTAMYAEDAPLWQRYEQACDFLEDDLDSGYVRVLQELIAAGWSNAELGAAIRDLLGGWIALLADVAREAERRLGPLGPFPAEELATLVASAFFGSESLLLLGFDREVLPIRSALRRVGVLIRQLEEGPTAPRRTGDTGMPAVP